METTTGKSRWYLTSVETDEVLKKWWNDLHTNHAGERAQLRRCNSPAEVAFHPAYIRLLRALQKAEFKGDDRDFRIASVAGLLAHLKPVNPQIATVTADDKEPTTAEPVETAETDSDKEFGTGIRALGKMLGRPVGGKALLSGLRFRRLLQTNNRDELYRLMLRVVRLVRQQDYMISPLSLAATIFWWNKETTRQTLAFGYYAAAPNDDQ